MARPKDWTEHELKKTSNIQGRVWKTFREPVELLSKTALKEYKKVWFKSKGCLKTFAQYCTQSKIRLNDKFQVYQHGNHQSRGTNKGLSTRTALQMPVP